MNMESSSITGESLSDQAFRVIKTSILNGTLKPGERVTEASIADQFGLSRTPVRDALRRLGAYGLIRIKPRSYAEVVSLAPEEAEDVAHVRAALESLAIRQLADRGQPDDFDALEAIAHDCQQALTDGDVGKVFEIDSRFHLEIARRSGNVHLQELFEHADAKIQLLRLVLHLPYDKLAFFVDQHWEMLRAVRRHDTVDAVRLIQNHVLDQLKAYQRVG